MELSLECISQGERCLGIHSPVLLVRATPHLIALFTWEVGFQCALTSNKSIPKQCTENIAYCVY